MLNFNNLKNLESVYVSFLRVCVIFSFSHSFFSEIQEELNFVNSELSIKI